METTALQPSLPQEHLTTKEVLAQVQVIQSIMKSVMKDGEHYGVVPGCGNKPTLLKAGAEKLMHTFRFAPDYEIIPLFLGEEDKVGYRVECRIKSIVTQNFLGSGVGECSSEEEKYRWRKAICEAEYDNRDPFDRRLKYYPDGGTAQQVKTNAHDLANTILKMAKKRALVDAVLTVCAASDIFAQDLEELTPSHNVTPRATASTAQVAPNEWIRATIANYTPAQPKQGNSVGKPHKFTFAVDGGGSVSINGFQLPDGWDAPTVQAVKQAQDPIQFQFVVNGKFKNLSALRLYSPATAASPEPDDSADTLVLNGNYDQ